MSPKVHLLTVPSELQPIVHACMTALRQLGFALKPEHAENDYPESATIFARQSGEQHFYIFDTVVQLKRAALWAGYGRSCSKPTFVVHCIPQGSTISGDTVASLRTLGVGLTMVDHSGKLTSLAMPIDLTLNLQLPPHDRHRAPTKRALQKIHLIFESGDWKRGFEESCKLVENAARAYLLREVRASMVQVPGRKGPKTLTEVQVNKFTLGQLADVFCNKLTPKQIDSLLCSGLKRINPDRITIAHGKLTTRKKNRLRQNVGRHMWAIDNLLLKIPV
jgi:hypothetical protein